MSTVKILSGIITAAVVTSACSMAVFAQGTINSTPGDNGEITYTFSDITIQDKQNIVSADGVVTLYLGRSNPNDTGRNNIRPDGSYIEDNKLYLGTTNSYTQNGKSPDDEDCGDYIQIKIPEDGKISVYGNYFGYELHGVADYTSDGTAGLINEAVDKDEYVYIGYRPKTNSYITSIKFTPDEFTPDEYSEAYTFNLNADEIYGKSLVVNYTENNEDKTTEPKPLSELIKTRVSGEGNVLLTGLNFTNIPNTVTINTVTIE